MVSSQANRNLGKMCVKSGLCQGGVLGSGLAFLSVNVNRGNPVLRAGLPPSRGLAERVTSCLWSLGPLQIPFPKKGSRSPGISSRG